MNIINFLSNPSNGIPMLAAISVIIFFRILVFKRPWAIKGKKVLITGGGMGIGREMALEFAKEGCVVVIWDINQELAAKCAQELVEKHGCTAFSIHCDVSNREAVSVAAKETLLKVSQIDILVNNAGIVSGKLFTDLSVSNIERTMGVNFFSICWTLQEFLPAMIARKSGHVVTIASVMGMIGSAGLTDYCASKYAAVGLTTSLRLELKKLTGGAVRSSLICPYAINTGMFDGIQLSMQWLMPILEPAYVGRRVVDAVINREDVVVIPKMVALVTLILNGLPASFRDFIAEKTGALNGMDHFVGRIKKQPTN